VLLVCVPLWAAAACVDLRRPLGGPDAGPDAPPADTPGEDGPGDADAGGTDAIDDGDAAPEVPDAGPEVAGGGLVAYWALDEGTPGSIAADSSGDGNDGQPVNTPNPTNAVPPVRFADPASLSFSAAMRQSVVAAASGLPANEAPQTVAAWIWYAAVPTSSADFVALMSAQSGLQMGFYRDATRNGIYIAVWKRGGERIVGVTPPSPSAWHHFCYTFDGTTHTLYMDGNPAETSTTAPLPGVVETAFLGAFPDPREYFEGRLDDVRVYDRALPQDAVKRLAGGYP
jgi:hypothetical protein